MLPLNHGLDSSSQLTTNLILILSFSGICFCTTTRQNFYTKPLSFLNTIFKYLDYISEFILDNLFEDKPTARAISNRVSYKGYQLIRVWPRAEETTEELKWLDKELQIQLWTPLMKNHSTDIVLSPDTVSDFKSEMEDKGIQYTVLSSNLQKAITTHNPRYLTEQEKRALKETRGHVLTWTKYHLLEDIYDYMDYLQDTYSNLVEVIEIGRSSEGRALRLVKVSTGKSGDNYIRKPSIWIDAGIHGREWIAPAVALFILKQLVEHYATNKQLLEHLDWYILPVLNPDGYEYSHTTDRLWKKSRAITEGLPITRYLWYDTSSCQGVDLNRNWDFHWKEITSSNDNPCHNSYAGSAPFSELETKATSRFIWEQRDSIIIYLTLQSYSQTWLMPLSHAKTKDTDYDDLLYMGRKAIEALKKTHGTQYELENSNNLIYNHGAGSSADWAKTKAGIKYSYTIQLRDKGTFAFLLPASQIVPTGKEIFTAVRILTRSVVSSKLGKEI